MDRRLALVALWAAFAAAAVGVGFGAAGLVGDPFTDGVSGAAPVASSSASGSSSGPAGSGSATASPAPSGSSASPSATATPRPSRTGRSGGGDSSVTRTLQARGGLVSATCRSGSVRLSASPAVGWEIEDLDAGPDHDARVRFEPSGEGDGRIEVTATCNRGSPRFELGDGDDDGGDDGGDGGDD